MVQQLIKHFIFQIRELYDFGIGTTKVTLFSIFDIIWNREMSARHHLFLKLSLLVFTFSYSVHKNGVQFDKLN